MEDGMQNKTAPPVLTLEPQESYDMDCKEDSSTKASNGESDDDGNYKPTYAVEGLTNGSILRRPGTKSFNPASVTFNSKEIEQYDANDDYLVQRRDFEEAISAMSAEKQRYLKMYEIEHGKEKAEKELMECFEMWRNQWRKRNRKDAQKIKRKYSGCKPLSAEEAIELRKGFVSSTRIAYEKWVASGGMEKDQAELDRKNKKKFRLFCRMKR